MGLRATYSQLVHSRIFLGCPENGPDHNFRPAEGQAPSLIDLSLFCITTSHGVLLIINTHMLLILKL